jgi:hypothetical protein
MNDQKRNDPLLGECSRILAENGHCPSSDELVAFHEEELDGPRRAALALHLGQCPECACLLDWLNEANQLPAEDETYTIARDADRRLVARALGLPADMPPAGGWRTWLARFWQVSVPAPVPALIGLALLLVLFWPAGPQSPVSVFGPAIDICSDDRPTRSPARSYQAHAGDLLMVEHLFLHAPVGEGTVVNRQLIGDRQVVPLDPVAVVLVSRGSDKQAPAIRFPLQVLRPGHYRLVLNQADGAFSPVTLHIEIFPADSGGAD